MSIKLLLRLMGKTTFFLMLMTGNILAQIPSGPVNIQSPNVASLGMFGKIPVSNFTGVPNIQIPIYTLQQKGTSVPISLNYHASGFRPDMHPGWVGSGWSLASGGVISRVIKDNPDDYSNSNWIIYGPNRGYYYTHDVLNTSSWNQVSYMQSVARDNVTSNKDTEPDEFSFNFGEYMGTFYLNSDGTWKVKSERPLSISMTGFLNIPFDPPYGTVMYDRGMSQTFGGFVVTTEDGTKYYFGGSTDAIEYSIDFFYQSEDEWAAESWHLTKIVSPGGEEINFVYERDSYINQMYISNVNNIDTRASNGQSTCSSSDQYYGNNYEGKLVAPIYLKQINGIQTVVKFSRSTSTELGYDQTIYVDKYSRWLQNGGGYDEFDFLPILGNGVTLFPEYLNKLQWKKLDSIRIEKTDGTLIKAFNFSYDNTSSERLRLASVTEQGSDLISLNPYKFSYDTSSELPGYLSNRVDHWGFYNGTYADIGNASTYTLTYYNFREPVDLKLYAGTLNKIIYPTGGITEFTYEPHYYSKRLQETRTNGIDPTYNSNTLAGGLRIKKIVSYDPEIPLQKLEKEYYYVTGYNNTVNPNTLSSSGVLGGQVKYYFNDYRVKGYNSNNNNATDVIYTRILFSTQSVLPGCVNAMGSHIGYTEVVEKLNDGNYTKYTYSNFDNGRKDDAADNLLQVSRTAYEPYSSNEEERGKLIKEENFNSTDKRVKLREISYTARDKANQYVPGLTARNVSVCPAAPYIKVEEGTAYRLYTYSYLPDQETTTIYDSAGQNGVAVTRNYNYTTPENLLKEEILTNSKGETVTTAYNYPVNMLSVDPTGVYQGMYGSHIYSPVIEKIVTLSGDSIEYERKDYLQFFPGIFLPRTVYTGPSRASAEPRFWYHAYDTNGNVLNVAKEKGATTSYKWGYKKQYPIAETSNGDMTEVYSQDFEEPELGLDFEANVIYDPARPHTGKYSGRITNGSTAEMVSHSSKKLNISLSAPKKFTFSGWVYSDGPSVQLFLFMMRPGETAYNSYVDNIQTTVKNKWVYLKKEFVVPADVAVVFLRLDNNAVGKVWFDDLRIRPSESSMSTYTYKPLIGMTSSIDNSGKTVYYEYDSFQRLKNIKDQNGNIIKNYDYHYKP